MKRTFTYQKLELWAATLGLGIFVFVLLMQSREASMFGSSLFEETKTPFHFYKHYFVPYLIQGIAFYGIFIFLSQYVEPKEKDWANAGEIAGAYLTLAIIVSITNTYADAWKFNKFSTLQDAYNDIFINGFTTVAIIFFIYIAFYLLKLILSKAAPHLKIQPSRKLGALKIAAALIGWLVVMAIIGGNNFDPFLMACWVVVLPYSVIIVCINLFNLMPLAPQKKFKDKFYLSRLFPVVLILGFIAAILIIAIMGEHAALVLPAFILLLCWTFLVVIPISWYLYKSNYEKQLLQTALGSSQANLGFLRSQINPHFLFNALNTLYGTALQENAGRTGEGIQKLGDMMRFMIHENTQDKISLAREVEYLNNYIDLQKLRTSASPFISIQAKLEEPLNNLQISPMLLIPFVENAFKHGISLKEPSYISVSLQTHGSTLYFDVHNSIHLKPDNDPEKLKSGIGLQNVKQRLALLYVDRHELIIRESAKDYFVHLTLML